jgi:PTH1 family peptidyl-tRNA hydrolase
MIVMKYLIVGLGNPDEEYENTRHNTGRIFLEKFRIQNDFDDFKKNKEANALYTKNNIEKHKIEIILPETFMNKSGKSVLCVKSKNNIKSQNIIVVYDDIDLPIGTFKLSFNRGSGGHKGIESIVRYIKTKEFVRVRIGISPVTPGGKIRKPKGEDRVHKFILGKFSPLEIKKINILSKKVNLVLKKIILDGYEKAVSSL